ncbi:40S ribosomal protein [Arachis hypogaea]|nr:40S ribosomal protein [Arachis hypogaea]
MVLQNDIDLLNPPAELEKRKHKLKRLVQSPNSFFTDVKCQVPLYSATLRPSWYAETARQYCASRQAAERG